MSYVERIPAASWIAVTLMIIGFMMCTAGFILGNNLVLWIGGGAVGGVGVVFGRAFHIMRDPRDLQAAAPQRSDRFGHGAH